MSSVTKAAKSPFAGLVERIHDKLIVETRTMKNDHRVTHAVHVNQRGAALRVLCGAVPVEDIGGYKTYALPSCRECLRIDAQPIRCAKASPRWLALELRRVGAEPMLRWLEAQDAAARARGEAEEEERARLKRERDEEQRAWAKSKKELAVREAARLAAEQEDRARLKREEEEEKQRMQAELKRELDGQRAAEVEEKGLRAERRARQVRADAFGRPLSRPDPMPSASGGAGVRSTTPPAADAVQPATREEPLPGVGRGSSRPGKKLFPAAERSREQPVPNAGRPHVAPLPDALPPAAPCLAGRILALVASGSYMSANTIAQAFERRDKARGPSSCSRRSRRCSATNA